MLHVLRGDPAGTLVQREQPATNLVVGLRYLTKANTTFIVEGNALQDALVQSGRRRLRPVLMTSLAAGLGMLAYGVGSGAYMLKPLAVAIIGALSIPVLLSLVATPTIFSLLAGVDGDESSRSSARTLES